MNVVGSIESLWDCRIILWESQNNIPLYTNCFKTILKYNAWLHYFSVPRPAAKGGDGEMFAASGSEVAQLLRASAVMRWGNFRIKIRNGQSILISKCDDVNIMLSRLNKLIVLILILMLDRSDLWGCWIALALCVTSGPPSPQTLWVSQLFKTTFCSADMCQANVLSCSLIIVKKHRDVLIMAFFKSFVWQQTKSLFMF